MTVKTLEHEAFEALALVASLGEICGDLERPERHAVRNLRRTAETLLMEAFKNAKSIAYEAKDLGQLVDKTRAEAQQPNTRVTGPA